MDCNRPIRTRIGVANLTRRAFEGANLAVIWNELLTSVTNDPADAAAIMDLSVLAQLLGDAPSGASLQDQALALEQIFRSPCATARPRLRLLAIAAATDIGGNIPLEFLLSGSDVELLTLYVSPDVALPAALPDHDLAIVAMGNADRATATLGRIAQLVAGWPTPVLNAPARIVELERDRLCALAQSVPGLECPTTVRITRSDLSAIAAGDLAPAGAAPSERAFPMIVRPVDSHAGKGLEKIEQPGDLQAYLSARPEAEFFISRFVDYANPDGLFRKYRIVFIDGRPFASHMAIAEEWKVWYLNANMEQSADKRAEEARFMASFDSAFAERHKEAFSQLTARVGLDYFGIDCAETKDGKLLLFEGETALIVHDMDPPAIYPYKLPQMRKLFAAFADMLHRRAGAALSQVA